MLQFAAGRRPIKNVWRIKMGAEMVTSAMLCGMPLFSDLTDEHVGVIAGISSVRPMRENQQIFHEGDERDFLYVVLEGRVALEMHVPSRGRVRILTVEPEEVLGWTSMADASPKRTLTARAVCDGKLLAIDAARLRQACDKDPLLGYTVMNHIANVIAGRLMATRIQLLDMFAQPSSEAPHG
jgi:CRP/FNR family cyclic AMP-dependent transcriptional regulator